VYVTAPTHQRAQSNRAFIIIISVDFGGVAAWACAPRIGKRLCIHQLLPPFELQYLVAPPPIFLISLSQCLLSASIF